MKLRRSNIRDQHEIGATKFPLAVTLLKARGSANLSGSAGATSAVRRVLGLLKKLSTFVIALQFHLRLTPAPSPILLSSSASAKPTVNQVVAPTLPNGYATRSATGQ